jgi:hypothetical protein
MSKPLLLVKASADRVGQRTTEHNRSSSPPDSRKLTGYNGASRFGARHQARSRATRYKVLRSGAGGPLAIEIRQTGKPAQTPPPSEMHCHDDPTNPLWRAIQEEKHCAVSWGTGLPECTSGAGPGTPPLDA